MDKKILIYGMGKTGKAVKKFCENNKIKYFTFDDNIDKRNRFDKLIKNTSKIIISPGISKSNENIKFAISKKIDVISEIEFASSYIEKPLIAITGTNGKTTTCLLTYALLKDLGKKVFLGGNIGKPLISSLNRKIEYDLYLVECSSFQLQFINNKFSPFISLITNLSPNHLDHHKNLKEYYDSKYKIFSNQKRNSYFISNIKYIKRKNKFFESKKINFITSSLNESKEYIMYKKIKIHKNKLKLIGGHNFTNIVNSLEILSIFIEPNKKTLDVGCGKGIYAKSVINFSPKKLTAIDISEKAIKIAKEETLAEKKNIDFRVENCEMTELKSEDYDVIYGFGILHHLNLEKSFIETNDN